MSCKVARFSVIGSMVLVAPLALAGCLAPGGDELASDEAVSELKAPTGEDSLCPPGTIFDFKVETCQSKWPGDQVCTDTIASVSDIVAGSISSTITGWNGEVANLVTQTGPRQINFWAKVHEGDLFNPGKNTTSYIVAWCRK